MSQGFKMKSGDAKNTSGNQRKRIEVPEIRAIQHSLVVATCDYKSPNLQSSLFSARIICNYNCASARINCN
jgi:hypothetical protein